MKAKQQAYRTKVVKELYFAKALSCADLCVQIDKSLPLTTTLLNEMIADGLVYDTGYAPSTGGRRPQVYALQPDMQYVIAIAMDQFVTRMAVINMKNDYVFPVKKYQLPLEDNPSSLDQLIVNLTAFINELGIDHSKIAGVGIGMPGFIDVTRSLNYTFLQTQPGEDIASRISAAVGMPVFIDNDSSLVALAEKKFGHVSNVNNGMVINVGWGIGLGMILNGELFRGNKGFAGELSHIPLFTNNKLCKCGKIGCLETETSLLLLIEKAHEQLKSGRSSIIAIEDMTLQNPEHAFEAIKTALQRGDKLAIDLFSEAAYNIGRSIAILIHLLNPETIILSGRGSLAGDIWYAPIQQAIKEHCIPRLSDGTTVHVSALGYDAEIIGAAALVMENYDQLTFESN
ncbi:MAG: ROK family protein [Filimonas sp.]|nr:ROK family protein [Filimonas sp.]